MSTIGHRNNNKAYPNNWFGWIEVSLDNTSWERWYYCNICRKIWDTAASASQSLKNHMINEHQYTDEG